jgi:cytochrome c-type biogenesis protein CcmH/NrfG
MIRAGSGIGLITGLLTLPLTPYRSVLWMTERAEELTEEECLASLTERLQRLHEDHRDGLLTDEELADAELEALREFGGQAEGELG